MDKQRLYYSKLIELSLAVTAEHNRDRLVERILVGAKELCNAEAGTLYRRSDDDHLTFSILLNDPLGISLGGTAQKRPDFPPLPLYRDGEPNLNNVATYAAVTGETVRIDDAYEDRDFDFSGTKAFDARSGFRSRSFLTVPLRNHHGEVRGVLQLINAREGDGTVTAFDPQIVPFVEALAAQAAVALETLDLIQAQKDLLESFIRVIAAAIDEKSPYTGGHCQRVPVLTEMLTRAACESTSGPFAAFSLGEDEWYELKIAAWLHDCGKITTPEHVVDKSTKLETIYDRINTVKARFAAMRAQAEADYWRAVAEGGEDARARAPGLRERLSRLEDDLRFLEEINLGGEFMAPEKLERLRSVAQLTWRDADGRTRPLLDEDEVKNLSVARGTLTDEERKIINDHIVVTIKMLQHLPFPRSMSNVVEYAGGHHEKMDGTGYPNGLTREQMSVPARVMAIADIFEALTAADRPYKTPKPLSETLRIMADMKKRNHIDPDLFDLFLTSGVYRDYAERFLSREQIDTEEIGEYLN